MPPPRENAFTLIELLVVIAIIAILAGMLFPVFARARESARKIQCLANVKNVAAALQMYLVDYERLPPAEHRAEVKAYFDREPGLGGGVMPDCYTATAANPYLRWAVILDEYVRSREIWRCPSARLMSGALWIIPGPDWFANVRPAEGTWGSGLYGGPCQYAWPTGWGGEVTDSLAQARLGSPGGAGGAFEQSVGVTAENTDLNPAVIGDPSWFVVCGDAGSSAGPWTPNQWAYPDVCRLLGCASVCNPVCCAADWENCPETQSCGVAGGEYKRRFWLDASMRAPFARHLGGSNLGFMDGHAAWFPAEAIVADSPTIVDHTAGRLRGLGCVCRPQDCDTALVKCR